MSDNISDIADAYRREGVASDSPIRFGLFCIPEYPERGERGECGEARGGMWAALLGALLASLRYLAPATLLSLLWGRPSFLLRILRHIDAAVRGIISSSDEQTQSILQWLSDASAVKVADLDTLWRQGWLLCGVLDAALPGACAGHPPSRLSLLHAQTIADHYLGVDPVFTRQELESQETLSRNQEWKLAQYLERVREALAKVPLPVSKPPSQRNTPEIAQINLDYIAQGSGLTAAQVKQKINFKIYPTANQCLEPGEINVLITGPHDTCGRKVIPPILGKAQQIRRNVLNLKPYKHYTENVLPITQGTTYLRAYGKIDMNKTYHIPKTIYDIDIEVETTDEFVRIGYTVNIPGKYEVNITTRDQHIRGSPFRVKATNNIIEVLTEDVSRLEDDEVIDVIDSNTERKVVLRIVDFVTEKMLLNENGSFERITEDEAKMLMSTDKVTQKPENLNCDHKMNKFLQASRQVILVMKTCKIFMQILKESKERIHASQNQNNLRQHSLRIPDVVNSTLYDSHSKRPSIDEIKNAVITDNIEIKTNASLNHSNLNKSTRIMEIKEVLLNDSELNMSPIIKQTSPTNPFLEDVYTIQSNTRVENDRDREEINETPRILIEEDNESISPLSNPFYDRETIERPKTPVLKIITGEVEDRRDSVYIDPDMEKIAEEIMGNEFINPFFMHQRKLHKSESHANTRADFLIGAPVLQPPRILASTPEPDMESMFVTSNDELLNADTNSNEIDQASFSLLTNIDHASIDSSTFRSIELNTTDTVEDTFSGECESHLDEIDVITPEIRPRRELWDSAYVSIDDANSSPDSNDSSSTYEIPTKEKVRDEDLSKMGPAEKELWQSCMELSNSVPRLNDEIKSHRWDIKRPTFTPIIEESDRSLSNGLKESEVAIFTIKDDPVAVAFAELNDVFQEYSSNSEDNSITNVEINTQSKELEQSVQDYSNAVKSASENLSDMMRLVKQEKGKISEVQANVTELTSVSQILQDYSTHKDHNDLTQFGKNYSNIVREKKKYWDDRIRTTEEIKTQEQKPKKVISKNVKNNDSLTKRRGRQIVENFLTAGEFKLQSETETANTNLTVLPTSFIKRDEDEREKKKDSPLENTKFVHKWKTFWNAKQDNTETNTKTIVRCYDMKPKSPKVSVNYTQTDTIKIHPTENVLDKETKKEWQNFTQSKTEICEKSDLSEEVFKAFETSPKRFFGRSRKQILNKIDAFLGQNNNESSIPEEVGIKQEKGIVSSRISLFHSISHAEDLPGNNIGWSPTSENNKCKELINSQTNEDRDDEICSISERAINIENDPDSETITNSNKLTVRKKTFNSMKNKLSAELAKTNVLRAKKTSVIEKDNFTPIHKRISFHNNKNDTEYHNAKFEAAGCKSMKKSCFSKSEMDIYTKVAEATQERVIDKYKSYEELPRTNVKHVITMYESVSRSVEIKHKPISRQRAISGSNREISQDFSLLESIDTTPSPKPLVSNVMRGINTEVPTPPPRKKRWNKILNSDDVGSSVESLNDTKKPNDTPYMLRTNERAKSEENYVSLSDIDLEIVEKPQIEVAERITAMEPTDYQSRFKMAKQFFQSLEELRPVVKKTIQNECQQLLHYSQPESQEKSKPNKVKKLKKSNSMPSSELSKLWKDYQDKENGLYTPVKISEKFNVDGLFSDVTEGKLSRQGSLRGIPHKKAVLETFKSMENVNSSKVSPYELAVTQLSEFAKENKIKNSQTYLTEYPYLPTTDPSKYHSRLDTKASGLISMKELLSKRRRNSFPDLRLDPKFSVEL